MRNDFCKTTSTLIGQTDMMYTRNCALISSKGQHGFLITTVIWCPPVSPALSRHLAPELLVFRRGSAPSIMCLRSFPIYYGIDIANARCLLADITNLAISNLDEVESASATCPEQWHWRTTLWKSCFASGADSTASWVWEC